MKLALFVLLISFAFANAFLFRGSEPQLAFEEENGCCIEDYLTAYYARFGLKKPEQVLQCYDKKSAALTFKHIELVSKLVQDAENRNKHQVHLDFVKLAVLGKALEHVHDCTAKTQDVQDLLKALNITDRNPDLLFLNSFIQYQAQFGELAKQMPPVVDALKQKDFKHAGELSADISKNSVKEIQTQGNALLALKGLWNGVHIRLDLPDSENIVSCFKNDTAAIRLEFIYGLSAAVAGGSQKDAAYNTEKWYEEKGKELVNKIPEDQWKCWAESNDIKRESEKLHIDVMSKEFYDKGKKFVYGNQHAYWTIQKLIKDNLEQHNFIHAGSAYGSLLQAAAGTKTETGFFGLF